MRQEVQSMATHCHTEEAVVVILPFAFDSQGMLVSMQGV